MQDWIDQVARLADLGQPWLRLIETAVLVVVIAALRLGALLVVRRNTTDAHTRYRWRKITAYVAFIIALFLIGRIWFTGFRSLATYLGLVSAGIALALREPVVNIAGWFFIMGRRPFVVGDRIEINGISGDVIDQQLFHFTLLEIGNWVDADQSTGRLVHIPNGDAFNTPLYNYTRGFPYIWNEIPVLITFESDWRAAKQILQAIADELGRPLTGAAERALLEASRRYLIFYSTLSPAVYTAMQPSGVLLTIRYLCEVRRRRGSSEAFWERILEAVGEHPNIEFAYPTQRFVTEGAHQAGQTGAVDPPHPTRQRG